MVVLTRDEDEMMQWTLEEGVAVYRDEVSQSEVPIERWAGGMLILALVRDAANGGVLEPADAQRVLARLGPDSAFTSRDLPY